MYSCQRRLQSICLPSASLRQTGWGIASDNKRYRSSLSRNAASARLRLVAASPYGNPLPHFREFFDEFLLAFVLIDHGRPYIFAVPGPQGRSQYAIVVDGAGSLEGSPRIAGETILDGAARLQLPSSGDQTTIQEEIRMRSIAMAMAILAGTSGVAAAAIKTQVVEYQQGDAPCRN